MSRLQREREDRIEEEMRTCVHFNGVQNDACEAGVNYHGLFGNGFGCFKSLTCLSDDGATVECSLRKLPSREEAEKTISDHDARIDAVLGALNAAHSDAKKKGLGLGHGGEGSTACPCGGTVRYSVASCNGHIHGRCDGECGSSWME